MEIKLSNEELEATKFNVFHDFIIALVYKMSQLICLVGLIVLIPFFIIGNYYFKLFILISFFILLTGIILGLWNEIKFRKEIDAEIDILNKNLIANNKKWKSKKYLII